MPDLPDYFDRLLARHTPTPADGTPPGMPGNGPEGGTADGRGRPVLVRPRLPGPFERIEALRGDDGEGTAPALAARPSPHPRPPFTDGTLGRTEREVRVTERETLVRTERDARESPDGVEGSAHPVTPLLRPAAPPAPAARPAVAESVRIRRQSTTSADDDGTGRRALTPATVTTGERATAAPSAAAPPRPRRDEAAARGAARQAAAGRRGGRPAERVVHVQIGRLEVTAAGGQDRTAAARPDRTVRRGPALSLTDYLSRDEKRN